MIASAEVGARLSPDQRRRHLIDTARQIIIGADVRALTMDHLAAEAGVSRALVYNYFGNRARLVGQLWEDVAFEWGGDPMPAIDPDLEIDDLRLLFETRLTITTAWYFDKIESGGVMLTRLMVDPDLGDAVADFRRELRRRNVAWWTDLCTRLGLDRDRALVFSTIFNRAVEGLWDLVATDAFERSVVEEVFATSARAAFDALLDTTMAT